MKAPLGALAGDTLNTRLVPGAALEEEAGGDAVGAAGEADEEAGAGAGVGGSGGAPALEGDPYSPAAVEARIRPPYQINPQHVPGRFFKPGKSPLPPNAEAVYATATRAEKMHKWFGKGMNGWYQFYENNAGTVHFSGIISENEVPNHVLKGF